MGHSWTYGYFMYVFTYIDIMHLDIWGLYGYTGDAQTSSGSCLFKATTSHDCVMEVGSATFPVTQADLDGWGSLGYWVYQTGTGRIILILYTEGGEVLAVPAHAYATGLVVIFRDASTRTCAAFDAKCPFPGMFNTSTTADPRPDLSGEGITLV